MNKEICKKWMRFAINEAIMAFDDGETPIGAVVVSKNKIIGRGYNQVEKLNDPTAHAEMIAITSAANSLSDWRLNDSSIFITKEPCPMCAGAIVNARVKRLIYGAPNEKAGAAWTLYNIPQDKRLNHYTEITDGILRKESEELLTSFFENKR